MKSTLAVTLLLIFFITTGQFYNRPGTISSDFQCTVTSVGTTVVKCASAPAAGTAYHITQIIFQSTTSTANQFQVLSGTKASTECDTTQAAVFPSDAVGTKWVGVANTVAPAYINFYPVALHLAAAKDLCVVGIATNLTKLTAIGYIQ